MPAGPARLPPIDPWFRALGADCHGLLLAAAEESRQDLPLLALADWLEEHDRPERAEYLRLQVLLRNNPRRAGPPLLAQRERARELERLHKHEWLGGLPEGAFLEGGLAVGFRMPGPDWQGQLARACETFDVRVLAVGAFHLGDEGARALAASPHLGRVASLDLRINLIGPEGARALAASPHLGRLAFLSLDDNNFSREGRLAVQRRWPFASLVEPI